MPEINALSSLRVLIVGLGREGVALASFLAGHGFTITATDSLPARKLGPDVSDMGTAGVTLVLGEHPTSLLDEVDLIFVSPGVPMDLPFLQAAMSRKIPLSTESRLFGYLCPAPIMAITGSSGKTTTTTLVGQIMKAEGFKTWVGGNIGYPLISVVDQIEPDDKVVMELSSFQLEYFHGWLNQEIERGPVSSQSVALAGLLDSWSPPISAILNITPNHLDRHPSMKQYVQAKRAIIDYQTEDGVAIMNLDNDMTRTIGYQLGSKTRWFSLEAELPGGACYLNGEILLFDANGTGRPLATKSEIQLRGSHNIANILAACLIAREAGASFEAMRQVITTFSGVEHRLEWVRERRQVNYYNDSIATSPERLIAALHSYDEPIVLLAGGRDKHLPWGEAAHLILRKTRVAILFGEATEIIAGAINKARGEASGSDTSLHRCVNLEEAVNLASEIAQPGDVVLLAPGCASFDAFKDFAERGRQFRELVLQLEA